MKCSICGNEIEGHGNNPWPLVQDETARCCDKCNVEVIKARFEIVNEKEKQK